MKEAYEETFQILVIVFYYFYYKDILKAKQPELITLFKFKNYLVVIFIKYLY